MYFWKGPAELCWIVAKIYCIELGRFVGRIILLERLELYLALIVRRIC